MEISIIVPCRNEAENVLELAERARAMFQARGIEGEVVFVNDGSTDNTGALIDELAARFDFVRTVHHPVNRGIPAGWETGCRAARGRYIAIMDGDLQYVPEDTYRLYRQLKDTNADIVQGWRSHIGRARDFRLTMSRVLHHMLRLFFGLKLRDIKSGFLICDREVFAHILRRRFSYYYFQTFIVVSAHHKGYRIAEIESLFEERKLGESFISSFPLKMIAKSFVDLAKGFVEFRLLSARTDILADFLAHHPVARRPEPLSLLQRLHLRAFAALMPLHHWKLSYSALRYYYQLRRTQWLRPEELRELQEARLGTLVKHAYRHVPYYREMFDRLGIDPGQIRRIDDLPRLPVLTKEAIRRNLHFDLMSDTHDKLSMLPVSTSGASGEPLTIYADRTQLEMRWAATLRNLEWTGYRFGERQARLWNVAFGRTRLQELRERLGAWLARGAVFSAVALGPETIGRSAEFLRRRRPVLVEGDAEALYVIASYLVRHPLTGPKPKGVVASEQTLTAASRRVIEAGFQSPVFDRYVSREFSALAHECEQHAGHHVNAESYIVEIVRDGHPAAPGELGDVVVTDLTNLSVPLIRYAVGDRAVATDGPCPCGRGLPRIGAIDGRPPAIIVGASGCWLPGAVFAELFKDYGHIVRRFQVVQERPGAIELSVVKGARFSQRAFDEVLDIVRQHLGIDTEVAVEFVEPSVLAGRALSAPSVSRVPLTEELFAGDGRPLDVTNAAECPSQSADQPEP